MKAFFISNSFPVSPSKSNSRGISFWVNARCDKQREPSKPTPLPVSTKLARLSAICTAAALLNLATLPSQPFLPLPTFSKSSISETLLLSTNNTSPTYIYDAANILPSGAEEKLRTELADLDTRLGYRLILITRTASTKIDLPQSFRDPTTTLIIVDPSEGNILRSRPSSEVLKKLTDPFWGEWTNRYGNQFYVRDRGGADLAALDAVHVLIRCLNSDGIYRVVPHVSLDQEFVCAGCAAVAGVVAGVASRTGGKKVNVTWTVLFSPLWATLFFGFGIGPVVAREGWIAAATAVNAMVFAGMAAAAWWWIPRRLRGLEPEPKEPDF